jgi:hypothetical protein
MVGVDSLLAHRPAITWLVHCTLDEVWPSNRMNDNGS